MTLWAGIVWSHLRHRSDTSRVALGRCRSCQFRARVFLARCEIRSNRPEVNETNLAPDQQHTHLLHHRHLYYTLRGILFSHRPIHSHTPTHCQDDKGYPVHLGY